MRGPYDSFKGERQIGTLATDGMAKGGIKGALAGALLLGGLAFLLAGQTLIWSGVGGYLGSLAGTLAAASRLQLPDADREQHD